MFTWICPQCGREVPPAYNECPDCAAKGIQAPPVPNESATVPAPPAGPQVVPPPQYAPPRGGTHLPTWLMAMLFALGFIAIGGGIFWFINHQRSQNPTAVVESPAAKPGAKQNPVQKFVEITGVRFGKSSKGATITFVLVNHSDTDLVGLTGNATIWGRTQKSEEDAVGTVAFETSIAAQRSIELTLPFTTKLKPMEMPDWQNITVDVQITAPVAG